MKRKDRSPNTRLFGHKWTQIIQFIVYLLGFGIAIYESTEGRIPTEGNGKLFTAILSTFAAVILMDSAISIIDGIAHDDDKKDTQILHENITGMFTKLEGMCLTHDICVFDTIIKGLQYCMSTSLEASEVYNTVLRCNSLHGFAHNKAYADWLEVKERSIAAGDTIWTEIISTHIEANDPVIKLVDKKNNCRTSLILLVLTPNVQNPTADYNIRYRPCLK